MGGVRTRLRKRPFKPPLPSVIMANVRSLRNKVDTLHAKCLVDRAYKEACIIALTETWLDEAVPDAEVSLDNFTILRADRTKDSGKERGGGVCVYKNNRWCSALRMWRCLHYPFAHFISLGNFPQSSSAACIFHQAQMSTPLLS